MLINRGIIVCLILTFLTGKNLGTRSKGRHKKVDSLLAGEEERKGIGKAESFVSIGEKDKESPPAAGTVESGQKASSSFPVKKRQSARPSLLQQGQEGQQLAPSLLQQGGQQLAPSLLQQEGQQLASSLLQQEGQQLAPSLLSQKRKLAPSLLQQEQQEQLAPSLLQQEEKLKQEQQEELTPSLLHKRQLASSLLQEEQLAPSLLPQKKQLAPSLLQKEQMKQERREQLAPSLLQKGEKASSLLQHGKLAPSLLEKGEKAPSLLQKGEKAQSLVQHEKKAQSLVQPGKLAPSLLSPTAGRFAHTRPSSRINTEIGVSGDDLTEFYQTRMGMVDLNTCLGTNWLSNLVIDAYLELITSNAPNLGVIPSYAITTFRASRQFPSQWLSKININGVRLWFIPAHIKLQGKIDHWALAVMDTYERTLSLYDSLNPGESSDEKDDYMKDTIAFFHALYDAKKVPFGGVPIAQINMVNVPRQENGYDCGVFVLMIAQIIVLEQNTNADLLANLSQQGMPQNREKIYDDLLKEKFDSPSRAVSSERLRSSKKVEKETATSHAVRPSQKISSFGGEQNIPKSQMERPISAYLSRIVDETSSSSSSGNVNSAELLSRLSSAEPDETNPTLQQIYEELQQSGMKCDDDDGTEFPIVKQRTRRTATDFINNDTHWKCVGRINKSAKPPKELYEKYHLKYLNTRPDRFILKCQTDNCPHTLFIFRDDGRVYANEMHNHPIKKLLTRQSKERGEIKEQKEVTAGTFKVPAPVKRKSKPIQGPIPKSAALEKTLPLETKDESKRPRNAEYYTDQYGIKWPRIGQIALTRENLKAYCREKELFISKRLDERVRVKCRIKSCPYVELIFGNDGYIYSNEKHIHPVIESKGELSLQHLFSDLEKDDENFLIKKTEKTERTSKYYEDQHKAKWQCVGKLINTPQGRKEFYKKHGLELESRKGDRVEFKCKIPDCPHRILLFSNDPRVYCNRGHLHLIDDEMSPPKSPFPDIDFGPAESSVAAFGQSEGPYHRQGSPSIQSVDPFHSLFEQMSPPETPQSKPTDQGERGQIPVSPISSAFWGDYELEEGRMSTEPETPQSSPRQQQ